jgi:hypothetical protein
LGHHARAFRARAEVRAAPLCAEPDFDAGCLGGDDAGCLVCAGDDLDGACGDADGVAHADEDAPDDAGAAMKEGVWMRMMRVVWERCLPDDELNERGGALVDCDVERVKLEFEENARCSAVVV